MKNFGFLIAAPQSGSGKTTVSLAIMAALCRRGLKVAPFKCGPDFIDPGYHSIVTGRPSINLDGWMCPAEFVRQTFQRHCEDADVAVIEGVMGLFDGIGPSSGTGSSAQIAAITGMPVVLVVNARGMAASAAALVGGFARFDPQIRLAGVIFNNVGSDSHARLLRTALSEALPDIAVLGCIPRDESLVIPSRHLGLVTVEDNPLPDEFVRKLADMAERCLDLDRLSQLSVMAESVAPVPHPLPGPPLEGEEVQLDISNVANKNSDSELYVPPPSRGRLGGGWGNIVRIAVARDAAFCFVYPDNLRLLEEAGAELVTFSPLGGTELPADIQGIYLPGGYPELYAEVLASNSGMLSAIRMAVASDMPVYAECGGFIYLTEGLDPSEDQMAADFAGIFPVRARMLPRRKALGYRQVELVTESVVAAGGAECRGHEFHYSEIGPMPDGIERCYRVSRQGDSLGLEGYRVRNCLASYIHLHFGSNCKIAPAFVDACRRFKSLPLEREGENQQHFEALA